MPSKAKRSGPEETPPQSALPGSSVRQEVLNVLLAQLLQERGLIAAPESIIATPSGSRRMPDILVDFQGLRLAIEGEFASPQAEEKASASALKRVEEGIAHVGIAVVYPQSLKAFAIHPHQLKAELSKASLEFAVITETEASQPELPFPYPLTKGKEPASFAKGNIDALGDGLRRSYDQLIKDEVLERAVNHLQEGIGVFINCLIRQPATTGRFASTLGIRELPNPKKTRTDNPAE